MWRGYFLIKKPAALSAADFATATAALKNLLGKLDADKMPHNRMQYRANKTGDAVILEANFDELDLDATSTTRLCKYISTALSSKYTAAQIKTALNSNVTIFGGIGANWDDSRKACLDYLATNSAAWGE